jgi:O-antigen ligase
MGAQRTILRKAIYWAGIMLFAFAFIKTQARGAMIGCAASLVVFLLLPHRNYPVYRRGLSILLMIGLLGLFMPGFYETATRRFDSIEKETSLEEANRVSTWEHVVTEVIPSYPVFGIGLGEAQFIRIMRDTGYEDKFGRTFDNPHSSYLEIAVAAGCVALLIFLTVNFLIIVTNVSFLRSNVESEHSLLLLGLTSGLVGFLVATASGQDMALAMRFAAAAAGLKCTRVGGSAGAPTRDEVEALLATS